MLEGERRAAAAAAAAMGHSFESEPLPLYAASGSVAALPSAAGGFGVGSGLAPDGGEASGLESGVLRNKGGGGLTAHDALSAELPPDGPSSEWINNAVVNAQDMLTTGGIIAADATTTGASRGMSALTVMDSRTVSYTHLTLPTILLV